jgi:kynurenine formamidase
VCSSDVIRSLALEPSVAADDRSSLSVSPDPWARLRRVRDLTHTLSPEFPVFPGYAPFRARSIARVEEDGYAANELCYAEHMGTHLDAPAHFAADGATTDEIPASRLVAPLVVVSIAERAAWDHDAELRADDLLDWERQHGRIPAGAVVALHSAWEERLHLPGAFLNADAAGVLHTPGFGVEAARFLVHERSVAGVATDTLSLDIGASTTYDAHRVLLGAGVYGLENVAGLDSVPRAGAVIVVGAPKHRGGTGGPARLLALY